MAVIQGDPSPAGKPAQCVLAGPTERVLAWFGDAWGFLSVVEQERATLFRFATDRDDFVAAHVLARACVARLLDVAPVSITLAQRCDDCGGEHGRPSVASDPDIHVTWSHGRGYVAAGAAEIPIGVDVEVLGHAQLAPELADTVLTCADAAAVRTAAQPERAFLRQWARKECLIKLGFATLNTVRHIDLAGLPVEPGDRPSLWRPWRDGLHVLDWWDGTQQAVGAAVTRYPDLPSHGVSPSSVPEE